MICCYCLRETRLTNGWEIYPKYPDLWEKPIWFCAPCRAWVGCHPWTIEPLGSVAKKELRQLRKLAHLFFDRIWKEGYMNRHQAYSLLSWKLGREDGTIHIGESDEETCRKIIIFSKQWITKKEDRVLHAS